MAKYDWIDDSKWFKPGVESKWFNYELKRVGKTKEEWLDSVHNTIASTFEENVRKFPEREALVFEDKRYTYKQLQDRVHSFGYGLLKIGVKKGDHLGLYMDNHDDYVCAMFAAVVTGIVLCTVDAHYRRGELEYTLKAADIDTLVMDHSTGGYALSDCMGMLQEICPELADSKPAQLNCKALPALKRVICRREEHNFAYNFDEIVEMGKDWATSEEFAEILTGIKPEDLLLFQYTSGTTGFPKPVLVNNASCYAALIGVFLNRWGCTETDRYIALLPLNSSLGKGAAILPLVTGSCCLLMGRFTPKGCLDLIQMEKATEVTGAPTVFQMMIADPDLDKYDLSSLDLAFCAGAPLPIELGRAIYDKLHFKRLLNLWAQSEGFWTGFNSMPEDALEDTIDFFGVPTIGTCIKIADPIIGNEMPVGEEGEVWQHDVYQGVGNSIGYYNMPDKSAVKWDKDGWLHTGDLGIMNAEGRFKISGRIEDLILVGGRNIYPAEIEAVLGNLPYVVTSSVFPVPDLRLGEVPMAYIQLKEGENASEYDVMHAIEKELANYKVPRYVRFGADWPMTPSGKIQKFALTDRFVKDLGLEEVAEKAGFLAKIKTK